MSRKKSLSSIWKGAIEILRFGMYSKNTLLRLFVICYILCIIFFCIDGLTILAYMIETVIEGFSFPIVFTIVLFIGMLLSSYVGSRSRRSRHKMTIYEIMIGVIFFVWAAVLSLTWPIISYNTTKEMLEKGEATLISLFMSDVCVVLFLMMLLFVILYYLSKRERKKKD